MRNFLGEFAGLVVVLVMAACVMGCFVKAAGEYEAAHAALKARK